MPTQAVINNFGSIKKMSVPPGWQSKDAKSGDVGSHTEKAYSPADNPDVTLSLFNRGTPVSAEHAHSFSRLLVSKIVGTELTENEIKALTHVFGYTTVGDNQYTNDGKKGTNEFPAFDIKSSQVAELSGKRVLKVRGTFQGNNGELKTEYLGYLIQNPDDNTQIDEIVFQSTKANGLNSFMVPFQEAIKTIEWK